MGIENPGRRRQDRAKARQLRFQGLRLVGAEAFQVVDAVGLGLGQQAVQGIDFVRRGGDDQLADALKGNAVGLAIVIERVAAGPAQFPLEAAFGVIDTGVDDFRIARTDTGADGVFGFQHDDLVPGHGHSARQGQADNAGADDDGIHSVGHGRRVLLRHIPGR